MKNQKLKQKNEKYIIQTFLKIIVAIETRTCKPKCVAYNINGLVNNVRTTVHNIIPAA